MRRRIRALFVLALTLGLLVAAAPALAAPTGVTLVVDEVLDGSLQGTIVSSSLPGCSNGTVETTSSSSQSSGPEGMRFRGTKVVHCESDNTLTFRYAATYRSCDSPVDWGRWRITGGTGIFDGARGRGFLVGYYTGGNSTACNSTGITDNWFGVIALS
ncbi:MAG: hypothetical protein WCC01_05890 [Acidimicrobiia bacterium]